MTHDDRLFLVTGATGKTGSGTVRLLLEAGHRTRAMVHREDERSRALAEAGAEVVVADFLDLDGMTTALRGVSGAYFCYPVRPGLLDATVIFAQAAADAGARSVVNMSQVSARRDARSNAARQHWLAERLLDRTGLITTHLRPTFFAEWLKLWWENRDGEGILRLPFGDGRHAPVAAADLSPVIASVLTDPEPHDRASYALYGPVEQSHDEIAATMAGVLGFPVHYERITVEEFASAMLTRGLPEHLVQHFSNVAVDYQNGVFAGTNDLVAKLGGTAPLTVGQLTARDRPYFDTSGPLFVPAP
jgi:uncharacterized protein YbjT (DUF2867 family)